MSYDEHLISQAGGDGDVADRLASIEAHRASMERAHRMSCSDPSDPSRSTTYGESAKAIGTLLALVRDQAAKLGRVLELCDNEDARQTVKAYVPAAAIRAALEPTP